MQKPIFVFAVLATVCASAPPAWALPENDLAIVVSKAGFAVALTSKEIRAMFSGDRERWSDGIKVVPVILAPERPEFGSILKNLFRMQEPDYRSYFLQAEFTGKTVTKPQEVATPDALKRIVAHTPGAIGCIRASDTDDSVRVIQVDGSYPGGAQYQIRIVH
jgi:hypothetical protein